MKYNIQLLYLSIFDHAIWVHDGGSCYTEDKIVSLLNVSLPMTFSEFNISE